VIYASTSNIAKDVTRLCNKKGEERKEGKEGAGVQCQTGDIEFLMH